MERVRRTAKPPAQASEQDEILFLFTVDTEVNLRYMRHPSLARGVEDQIIGRRDGRDYGVPFLMDMLERHGMRGTFFLDVLSEYQFGEGSMQPVADMIRERGHDIQLHLHTGPHVRFSDNPELQRLSGALRGDDGDAFKAALQLAIELFERRVGEHPVAYRSGGYNLHESFFPALAEAGIAIDSSLYPFKGSRVPDWMLTRTQPFRIGDVLEIPVSWSLDYRRDGPIPRQFAPFKADSGQQSAFTDMHASGPTTLVYLAHSYSLLERLRPVDAAAKAEWDAEVEELRRQWNPERRFPVHQGSELLFFGDADEGRIALMERGLAELAQRDDVRPVTLAEVHEQHLARWDGPPAMPMDPAPIWRGGRPGLTGTRRYSAAYLGELEGRKDAADAEQRWAALVDGLPVVPGGKSCLALGAPPAELEERLAPASYVAADPGATSLTELAELQDRSFDIVLSVDALMFMRDLDVSLDWLFDHVSAGGSCAFRVRPFLAPDGADLQGRLRTPLTHLRFPTRAIDEYLGTPARHVNPFCAATYITLFRRAGFEIAELERFTAEDHRQYEDAADKTWFYEPQELRTAELTVLLRRPGVAPDLSELAAP